MSQNEFWAQSLADRHAMFARLRALEAPPFFEQPENPISDDGDGYYALVKHADVVDASRHPEIFSSARGATSLVDLPPEFNEYFGSMISMDDPRHARLRRIVSRTFTPKMIKKFEEDVQLAAASVVDDLIATGPCDFVQQVSSKLPLKIICDMMGIGDEHFDMVLKNTNLILAGADPEFLSQDMDEAVTQLLTAGADLAGLVTDLAAARQKDPGDDLITALASANVDGEQLSPAELGSFFILLVVAGNETTRFREGDKVALMYWSANRDETVFDDPMRFDITRSPNPHAGFGGAGPHFCLGAHLARREITVMLRELLHRVPAVRASGEPDRLLSSFINGIKHLPCELS